MPMTSAPASTAVTISSASWVSTNGVIPNSEPRWISSEICDGREDVYDQQVGVGADGAGFINLVRVEQEVFAQNRGGSRCTALFHRGQVCRLTKGNGRR